MSTINRTIIEIHALETTAAGNLNRDDTGSLKPWNTVERPELGVQSSLEASDTRTVQGIGRSK